MELPALVRQIAEKELSALCERRAPADLKDMVRVSHEVRGSRFTLFEERPPWRGEGPWTKLAVAQFRYDHTSATWELYCRDRNERWHSYTEANATRSIRELIDEVDEDPTGIFWG